VTLSLAHYMEDLWNVVHGEPLFSGDSISHATLETIIERGWDRRLRDGTVVATFAGIEQLEEWLE